MYMHVQRLLMDPRSKDRDDQYNQLRWGKYFQPKRREGEARMEEVAAP